MAALSSPNDKLHNEIVRSAAVGDRIGYSSIEKLVSKAIIMKKSRSVRDVRRIAYPLGFVEAIYGAVF